MPAVSEEQRRLMAIAEHHPEKLYKRNRGVLKMSHEELHKFASTKGLHRRRYARALRKRRRKKTRH